MGSMRLPLVAKGGIFFRRNTYIALMPFLCKKMVKKTIWAIGIVVLLAGVLTASAQYYYGMTRYGAYYQYPGYYGRSYVQPYTYNYPLYTYVPSTPYYEMPYYIYPYEQAPLSSRYIYRYGAPLSIIGPETSYPAAITTSPRGTLGQLCGRSDNQEYGCEPGLVCDYSQTTYQGLGVCMAQGPY